MGNRSHLQKQASSQSTFTPVTNFFQPRPFAPPREVLPQQQETPDLQKKQEKPKGFGYSLANISITNRNGAGRLPIQTKLTIGQPGDKYEQEADSVAAQVVNKINTPVTQRSPQGETVQRFQSPEEDELRMKPIIQRQEALGGGTATPDLEASIKQARGSGQPLGEQIRTKMEGAFGANFSGVKIHTDTKSDLLNRSIQARAFTTGNDIFFRQGAYNPGSRGGQELLAHELTHVVQQTGASQIQPQRQQGKSIGVSHVADIQRDTESSTQSNAITPGAQSTTDPWKSAQIVADPKLLQDHEGTNWYIKANQKFATVTNGEIGNVGSSFPGGQPVQVELESENLVKNSLFTIPAKTPLYSPSDPNKSIGSYPQDISVKKVRDFKHKEIEGCVVKYGSNEHWLPKSNLIEVSENGYFVKYGQQKYWVPEKGIEKQQAGFVAKDDPLFPEEGPKPDHILQGGVGNCYLMAALASLTVANANFVKQMMQDNNDGTVTVRLYDVTKSSNSYFSETGDYASDAFEAKERLLRVNKSVAQKNGQDLYANKFLWVQMVEKAYAASGMRGNLLEAGEQKGQGAYEDISGGSSKYAFEVLTGKEASSPNLKVKKSKEGGADAIFTQIQQALKDGKAVAVGTRQLKDTEKAQGAGHSGGESKYQGMVSGHAYSVMRAYEDGGKKLIEVRNPWGSYGRTLDKQADDKKGTFSMELSDFLDWFDSLSISGAVKSLPAQ